MTAVVCTTWLKAYRAYKKAYRKGYKRGNALLLGKTVNQKYKVELFKQKWINRWNSTKSADEWLTIILEIWWLIWHISGEHMPGGQAPEGRVVIKMHLFIRRGVISWLDCSFNVLICWKIVKMSKWLIGRLWFSHKNV